ncbi:hypothetical protein GCM10017621_07340 [Maricaulis virginensis]|uniref:Peptidase S9 prolyl oligopeptidase catalytic domain-containing protein n=1 Tax=Maricaulis virginensis TaxID=144022 RepID=A0A9W6IJ00_9PROT|nr:hypothetical protein GCM10017621_07340 [Maricaulis virginensis]
MLAAMTLTLERYRCGIAGAGVSHIVAMMGYEQERLSGGSQLYWARNIGDWRGRHRENVDAISPALHAGRVQAPLMIIHGSEGIVVPYEQAETMAEAMDAAGRPYELMTIDGALLFLADDDQPQAPALENLIAFLQEHNPPE